MTQYTTVTNDFLNTNRNIYEVIYAANGTSGNVVSTVNPLPVSLYSSTGQGDVGTVEFGNSTVDAFGRLRVSEPHTLFDSTLRYSDDTRNWSTANTGSAYYTHTSYDSTLSMVTTTNANDSVVRQTKRHFVYQPGKSLLIINTFTMEPKANVTQRVGYYGTGNGIYFELEGTDAYIVKRSNSSGTIANTRIAQADWSENPLNLDFSKSQIFWSDIEWLGVGTVRTGFVVDGKFVTCHKFHHANNITGTYMTTATLPVRYEIVNTGIVESNTTLKQICSSVMSEAGFTPKVATRAISTSLGGLAMSQTEYRPLIAIRLKSNRSGGIVVPSFADLFGLQTTPFNYKILQGATITGGTWVSSGDESHAEYNITATALSGGRNLLQGMFIGGTYAQPSRVDFERFGQSFQLRSDLDGTMETFVVAALATTNNDDALASLTWEEYN